MRTSISNEERATDGLKRDNRCGSRRAVRVEEAFRAE